MGWIYNDDNDDDDDDFAGVNLLIGTDNGLMLLDRSGAGKGFCYVINILFSVM